MYCTGVLFATADKCADCDALTLAVTPRDSSWTEPCPRIFHREERARVYFTKVIVKYLSLSEHSEQ